VARKKESAKANGELDELRELVEQEDIAKGPDSNGHSRRGLLKIAGAALAGAAGTMALRAVPAAALTGQAVLQGCLNLSSTDADTELVMGNSAPNTPTSAHGAAFLSRGGAGVKGAGYFISDHSQEIGVIGQSKGSDGTGNLASSTGVGVAGAAHSGVGVQGLSVAGTGGQFISSTGWDASLGQAIGGTIPDPAFHGSGRLAMVGRTDVGGSGPNIPVLFLTHSTLFAGGHFQHELVRGNDGSIWATRYDITGPTTANQFRWKRINTLRVDTTDGLGTSLKPLRLYDSRSSLTGPGKGPWAPGTVNTHTVAGAGAGAQNIPADAIAVTGNLTAVSFTQNGFLTIFPAGATYNPNTDPSTMNFSVGQYAIANSFVCGLTNGQLKVYVGVFGSTKANYIIDINGYIQ
jgi:hypothetical protein